MTANEAIDRIADRQRQQADWQSAITMRHDHIEADIKQLKTAMVDYREQINGAIMLLATDVGKVEKHVAKIEKALGDYRIGESLERANGQQAAALHQQTLTGQLSSLEERIKAQIQANTEQIKQSRWLRLAAIGIALLVPLVLVLVIVAVS